MTPIACTSESVRVIVYDAGMPRFVVSGPATLLFQPRVTAFCIERVVGAAAQIVKAALLPSAEAVAADPHAGDAIPVVTSTSSSNVATPPA